MPLRILRRANLYRQRSKSARRPTKPAQRSAWRRTFGGGDVERRTHISAPMMIYSLVCTLVAVGAFNSQNNLLFWLFGLAIGMIIVSGVYSGMMLMAVSVTRHGIEPVAIGEVAEIGYTLSNTSRVTPSFGLTIEEVYLQLSEQSEPVGQSLPGDVDSQARGLLDAAPTGFVSCVPRRGQTICRSIAVATARGRVQFAGVRITSSFPFGIVRKSLTFWLPASLVVTPRGQMPDGLALAPANSRGPVETSRRGEQGDEVFGVREYQQGDSPRKIAWRNTARTGELRIRMHVAAQERSSTILLLVEPGAKPETVDEAVELVAGSVRHILKGNGRVGVILPRSLVIPARSGRAHEQGVLLQLGLVARHSGLAATIAPDSAAANATNGRLEQLARRKRVDLTIVATAAGTIVKRGGSEAAA